MAEHKYSYIYQAVVTKTDDPEKRGRIRCMIPEVLGEEAESAWCDPVIQVAYDEGGDFCIPEIGETVWLMFINGDANRPVWIGGWWSKEKSPLKTDYSRLDDTRIISYKDFKITIHEKEAVIENGGNKIEMTKDGITISSSKKISINAPDGIFLNGGTPVARQGDSISHDAAQITSGSGKVFAG